jgi:dTDP-glucose pyrophosphorylase
MPIAYIICAAGAGTRTQIINPSVPKPLLLLNEKTFIEHSLSSFHFKSEDKVILVGQKRDGLGRIKRNLEQQVATYGAHFTLIEVNQLTAGQLDTALIGAEDIPDHYSIVVFNSDSCFDSREVDPFLADKAWEGLIPCSHEQGVSWSFCKVAESGSKILETLEVTEKVRISDWCSIGYYFFRDAKLFKKMARSEIQSNSLAERYVAPLYNRYIADSRPVGTVPIKSFKAMGTIEQIQHYWNLTLEEIQEQNKKNPYGISQ